MHVVISVQMFSHDTLAYLLLHSELWVLLLGLLWESETRVRTHRCLPYSYNSGIYLVNKCNATSCESHYFLTKQQWRQQMRKKNRGSSETGEEEEEPTHSLHHLLVSRADLLSTRESPQGCIYFITVFKSKGDTADSFLQQNFNCSTSMSQVRRPVSCVFLILLTGACADTISQKSQMCYDIFFSLVPASQPGQEEDGQMQHPEVSEEDLSEAKNQLGRSGPAKSKTFQVMEECGEKAHKHDRTRKHAWQTLTIVPRGNGKGNSL